MPAASRRPVATTPTPQHLLVLGALGVVYGDIGTSPLYTLRETLVGGHGLPVDELHVLGSLSLIFWALMLSVTLKYVLLLLRADNQGEGGSLALGTLAAKLLPPNQQRNNLYIILAIIGFSLFVGECLITPAISVLSAVEGLKVIDPNFQKLVLPIACGILLALFWVQSRGTGAMGATFGPVICVWFTTLGVLGVWQILQNPQVLAAINPLYAWQLVQHDGWKVFLLLGTIVLCITGAEALYADMGHFGRRPIQIAWFGLVLPGLLLNYFGQGALVLREPELVHQVFFKMAPDWLLWPLVALATAATIIASQAVITGLYSITKQAVLLGYLPRLEIRHTSATEQGQIYMPQINWLMMVGVLGLVLTFQSSGNLAAAYGIAVVGVMLVSSIIGLKIALVLWRWPRWLAGLVFGGLALVDILFFISCLHKIEHGGWFPVAVSGLLVAAILIWRHGRRVLYDLQYKSAPLTEEFLAELPPTLRVPGTAVYLTADPTHIPKALLHNLHHNKVLHERIILIAIKIESMPWWPRQQRVEVLALGQGVFQVTAHYGFMDRPDVPRALARCAEKGLVVEPKEVSFFLNREVLVASRLTHMGPIEERIFIWLSNQALNATQFFRLPPKQVLELTARVEI